MAGRYQGKPTNDCDTRSSYKALESDNNKSYHGKERNTLRRSDGEMEVLPSKFIAEIKRHALLGSVTANLELLRALIRSLKWPEPR